MATFCNRCAAQVGAAHNFCARCGAALYLPAAVHVTAAPLTRVVVARAKSMTLAVLLTLFFGPFGLLYSNPILALLLLAISIPAMAVTGGLAFFLIWIGSIVAAVISVNEHNERLLTCAVRC